MRVSGDSSAFLQEFAGFAATERVFLDADLQRQQRQQPRQSVALHFGGTCFVTSVYGQAGARPTVRVLGHDRAWPSNSRTTSKFKVEK